MSRQCKKCEADISKYIYERIICDDCKRKENAGLFKIIKKYGVIHKKEK